MIRRLLYLARFFYVVPPMPLLMLGTLAVVTASAIVLVVIDPTRAAAALTPLLLLQMFACASGVDVPARRGHYDLLLAHGETRGRVAIAHWIASCLPGVLSWLMVALAHHLVTQGQGRPSLFSGGTVSAFILVSTIPWATTVRLPRFSGAIGWLLVVSALPLVSPGIIGRGTSEAALGSSEWMRAALAVLVYPPLLVGRDLPGLDRLIVLPALSFALVALFVGVWSVSHRDMPLETAQ